MEQNLTLTTIDKSSVWRIAIGDSLLECKQTWTNQGFDVNHFEAITPDTMPNFLKFGKKEKRTYTRKTAEFTKVEKAIFYSHFMLWRMCFKARRPIVVIEHDTQLIQEFPLQWEIRRLKYFCVGHHALRADGGYDTKYSPAAGYVLTPLGAEALINYTKRNTIIYNVDHYIRILRDKDSPSWAVKYAEQKERDHDRESMHNK